MPVRTAVGGQPRLLTGESQHGRPGQPPVRRVQPQPLQAGVELATGATLGATRVNDIPLGRTDLDSNLANP